MKFYRSSVIRILLALSLVLILLLSEGCAKQQTGELKTSADTINITDCLGRQVKIPTQINRIACLCPESGYILAMLGKGDKIVAVVNGIKRDIILTEMYPNIKDASVPKSNGAINIEELIKTKPDVVFVKNDFSISGAEAEKLNNSKVPFLVVNYNSMQEQQDAIEMIGTVVGASDKARKYNEYYRKVVRQVQSRVAEIPGDKKLRVYHSVNEATRTDTKGTLEADWTQASGAVNVSINENLKLLEGSYYAGLEQILLWDPEVILVNELGVADYILTNKQWSPLQAVKKARVFQLPSGISRWGHPSSPETPLVILWTAKTLYPDRFTDLNMAAETKFFYKEFFNLQLSDDTIRKILSGAGMRAARQ